MHVGLMAGSFLFSPKRAVAYFFLGVWAIREARRQTPATCLCRCECILHYGQGSRGLQVQPLQGWEGSVRVRLFFYYKLQE
jgi:hypothetical protein